MEVIYNFDLPLWINILKIAIYSLSIWFVYGVIMWEGDGDPRWYSRDECFKEAEDETFLTLIIFPIIVSAVGAIIASAPAALYSHQKDMENSESGLWYFVIRTICIYILSLIIFGIEYAKWKRSKRKNKLR